MRIRTVKPLIWHDEKVGAVSRDARLLFIGLITLADDAGRFRNLPSIIGGHVYPYEPDVHRRIPKWMSELKEAGLVELYGNYGWLPKWESHQRISHPAPSVIPPPNGAAPELLRNGSGGNPERLANGSGGKPE